MLWFCSASKSGLIGVLVAFCLSCAQANVKTDTDRRPQVTHGVSATILYPGQSAPTLSIPPSGVPGARPGAAQAQGAYSGGTSRGPVMIGGTSVEEIGHTEFKGGARPSWFKYLAAPFAVAAYPFKKAWDALKPAPQPAAPAAVGAPPSRAPSSPNPHALHEQAQLEQMRRELAMREKTPAAPTPATPPSPHAAPTRRGASLSIAEELAALRAGTAAGASAQQAPPPASTHASVREGGVADRVVDRDGDGRPDHWIYRDGNRSLREVFDDDGDGTPNRTVLLDPSTGKEAQVEEDVDGDGRTDSWTEYQGGELMRRRADSDGNGFVDTWTFYRSGVPFRHEQDTDGDGFRDRIGYYEGGQLRREEEDLDGDGHPERVSRFAPDGELSEREEDSDGDGVIDQRAYYEGGRLVRRELLTEAAARKVEEESVTRAPAFSESAPRAVAPPPPGLP
jgi:hypothetical protein